MSDLRRTYFAQAGEIAIRYGICFERVIEHIHDARADHPNPMISAIRHLDDLVHAAACVDHNDLAWRDLVEQHERALIRGCRQWLDATDAIVLVRRLLADLRRDDEPGVRSLHSFDGTCTLRRWLGDRIVGSLSRGGVIMRAEPEVPGEPFDSDGEDREGTTGLAWPADPPALGLDLTGPRGRWA